MSTIDDIRGLKVKKIRWRDTKECTTSEPSRKQEERKTEK